MYCKKCGSTDCQIINEVHTTGTDFSLGKGCCGAVLFGPIGVLCGACGEERKTINKNYWVCRNCGYKFRV